MDSNEPDLFKQLPFVSENPSRKQSSESTGPKSPSTTMSEPSQQSDLEALISSAAGFPASLGVSPGSSEAQKMTVTSGRSWLPLLKSYGLNGSLGRMCEALLTNRWASGAAFLTWKASGIKPRHLLFQLAPSMPRTDETGSGLWLGTPTAAMTERSEKFKKGRELNPAEFVKMWPTPRSFSAMAANITEKTTRPEGYRGNLEEVVARTMWPTPNAGDDRDQGNLSMPSIQRRQSLGKQLNLSMVVSKESGALNPEWVEWLMGFPPGWTNLTSDELQPELKTEPED